MSSYLPTTYQQFIATSRYSRWVDDLERRETWDESVDRYFKFFRERLEAAGTLSKKVDKDLAECQDAVLNLEVMPSMRCLMTAGKALERDEISAFNCAYISVDHPHVFDEILFILCNGTGIGFGVESADVANLPEIPSELHSTDTTIVVADSKLGWATSFRELISMLYAGKVPKWDVSRVRPAGARLKTFGGRASGPGPLVELFKFTVDLFRNATGGKLKPIECHDLVCKVAEIVVVGGVRRCLPGEAEVFTPSGIVKISDLNPGDIVSTVNGDKRVIAKESNGIKSLLTIKTQIGDFESTAEHRWAVLDNIDSGGYAWKQADKLTAKDVLVFNTERIAGVSTHIPEFSYAYPRHSTTCKSINTKALSTDEWAWLIGFLHGDGYINKNLKEISFAVSEDQPETREKLFGYINRTGVNCRVQLPKVNDRCYKLRIKSKQLATYLSQFKLPKTPIDIPHFVKSGLAPTRLSYIAGLMDADGSMKTSRPGRKPFIVVTTVYPGLSKQVRSVLASLGYAAASRECSLNSNPTWKQKYSVRMIGSSHKNRLAGELMMYSEKTRNDFNFCESKKEQCSFTVAAGLMRSSARAGEFHEAYRYTTKCSWDTFSTGKENFIPISILGITESVEAKEVWDIEVEGGEFITEGLVTHNSALLSISDLSDVDMRHAKSGKWWEFNQQRALSNNSAVYDSKPEIGQFLEEWTSLYRSGSGERGIFNRHAAKKYISELPNRDPLYKFGANPCNEILLRSGQFCNLTSVQISANDTAVELRKKIGIATILGTLQSSLTDFRYLRRIWKKNTEEERLLGVSLSGICDNPLMSNPRSKDLPGILEELREYARGINKEWADILGINASTAITCVKPEGTTSQLCDRSSGIHPRFSEYYIRTVRADKKDPLARLMKDSGFPAEDDVTKPDSTWVFSFPMQSPKGAVLRDDMTAIDQLKLWMVYKQHWADHTVSCTVYVRDDEWIKVAAWVYDHFDDISGISFLPHTNHSYKQAPYQVIDKEQYEQAVKDTPAEINWSLLSQYELEDATTGSHELACSGPSGCEII